jgi:hypothetical protein
MGKLGTVMNALLLAGQLAPPAAEQLHVALKASNPADNPKSIPTFVAAAEPLLLNIAVDTSVSP